MENDLISKYLRKLKSSPPSPARGTLEGDTIDNQEESPVTDSFPIVFPPMNYKKAKLSKGKEWFAWFEYRNPVTGEFQQFTRKLGINRIKGVRERTQEGNALVDAINRMLAEGWSPFGYSKSPDTLIHKTLIECLEYLLSTKKDLRPRTYQSYKDGVRLFKEFLVSAGMKYFFPVMFKSVHAIQFADYMIMVKKYSGKTFNSHRDNIRMFFIEMENRELIEKNPIKVIKKRPESAQKNLAYNAKERELLKGYFKKHKLLGEFCEHIYYLGIRPNELLQVQLRDIFIKDRKIMIYTGASKSRRQEPVYMSEGMISMLVNKDLHLYKETDYLFGHMLKTGPKSWDRNRVSEMHTKAIRTLGLNRDHTLYSWKHTGAIAFYYANGKDPYKLMKHLRQTEIQTTMRYLRSLGLDYNESIQVPDF